MQVSPYLREGRDGYFHWCPGCMGMHYIQTKSASGPNWKFNNDVNCPDFKPSVKITHNMTAEECKEWGVVQCCHYFIDNGHLNYCSDSTHDYAGKSILLPELPENHRDLI